MLRQKASTFLKKSSERQFSWHWASLGIVCVVQQAGVTETLAWLQRLLSCCCRCCCGCCRCRWCCCPSWFGFVASNLEMGSIVPNVEYVLIFHFDIRYSTYVCFIWSCCVSWKIKRYESIFPRQSPHLVPACLLQMQLLLLSLSHRCLLPLLLLLLLSLRLVPGFQQSLW